MEVSKLYIFRSDAIFTDWQKRALIIIFFIIDK